MPESRRAITGAVYHPGTVYPELAVFPLPGVVLFPGALLPLHIFEPRYREMTRDLLAGDRHLAMACVDPDREQMVRGQPAFASVAGLGEIVRHRQYSDGRFDLLVAGRARVQLDELALDRSYRRARAMVLATIEGETEPSELSALSATAEALLTELRRRAPGAELSLPQGEGAGALADACAHYLIIDPERRQELLETLDNAERVRACTVALLRQHGELGGDAAAN